MREDNIIVSDKILSLESQQKIMLDNITDMVWLKDKESRFIAVNQPFALACGFAQKDIIGKTDLDIWPKELAESYRADDFEVMQSKVKKCVEEKLIDSKGGFFWVETIKVPVFDDSGEVVGTIGIARNITERVKERVKVEESLRELRGELDIRVRVRTAEINRTNEELLREVSHRKKIEVELTETNAKLKEFALVDSLTGLYSYRYLNEAIEAEFHRARRYVHSLAVTVLDIDYFKSINDLYGITFGDLVLKQFADELKRLLRRYDIVIRCGGEEFLVISPGIDRQQAINLAGRLQDTLNFINFGNKEHTVKLKVSLSVVSFPDDRASKGMDLVNLANQIINLAKEAGGNRVYSSLDLNDKNKKGKLGKVKIADINILKEKLDKLIKKTNQGSVESIFAFAKTIELKDHYTGEHVEKTVYFATQIAKGLKISKDDLLAIQQAAMLHDLGKIGISENILLKKGKLTKEEFEEIKKHPQIGADIIRPVRFLHDIIPLILYHHERWDGKGYLSGLKGENIPVGARIIAIADVYQALISDRPYHKAFPKKEAIGIIKEGSGTQFDSRIVNVFLKVIKVEK